MNELANTLLPPANPELPGQRLGWLQELRREGRTLFQERGLPTTRDEDWRFTDLRGLAQTELSSEPSSPQPTGRVPRGVDLSTAAERLIFHGGVFWPEASTRGELPDGVHVSSLAEALALEPERLAAGLGSCAEQKTRSLTALNSALFADGASIVVGPGRSLEKPVHLVFVEPEGSPGAVHPRNVIRVGDGGRVTVLEHYLGAGSGGGLTNAVTEIILGRDARVDHILLQEQATQSFHLGQVAVRQEQGSELRSFSIATGARLSRVDIQCLLAGEGAHSDLFGVYLARGRQHVDHHTTIDHATPRTTSRELYKGILNDRARGVVHGRIHVRPDAQKIDANQTNRTLLLSGQAEINTKPQLEIWADDVKCSHGASIGQLNRDQLFYLQTRGLGFEEARALLTLAFASEVISQLPLAELRTRLDEYLHGWLGGEAV